MSLFNKEDFNKFILENKVIEYFEEPIKLSSGRESNLYFNIRKITNDVYLLDRLTDFIIAYVKDLRLDLDCFYGVPEGATKIALITQFKWAKQSKDYEAGRFSLPMGRGKPKNHGDPADRNYIGAPTGRTLVIEDVVTTGKSLENTIELLRNTNAKVIGALAIIDRSELEGKSLGLDVPLYTLSKASELI